MPPSYIINISVALGIHVQLIYLRKKFFAFAISVCTHLLLKGQHIPPAPWILFSHRAQGHTILWRTWDGMMWMCIRTEHLLDVPTVLFSFWIISMCLFHCWLPRSSGHMSETELQVPQEQRLKNLNSQIKYLSRTLLLLGGETKCRLKSRKGLAETRRLTSISRSSFFI